MTVGIGTIAVLTNCCPLHIGKQANQHPRVKAFSVRHNELVSVRFDVASKKWEPLTDKVLRTKVHRFFNQYPSKRPCLSSPSNCARSNLGVESKKGSPAIK